MYQLNQIINFNLNLLTLKLMEHKRFTKFKTVYDRFVAALNFD